MIYELYEYQDDPETLEKIGPVVTTERHYANGAITTIVVTEDDTLWFMDSSSGVSIAHGQIYTNDRQYGPVSYVNTRTVSDYWSNVWDILLS